MGFDDDDDKYGTEPEEMARSDDPETSVDRAESLGVEGSASMQRIIHRIIKAAGIDGATIHEVTLIHDPTKEVSVSPMFAPMRRDKHIFYAGVIRNRGMVHLDMALREQWMAIAPQAALDRMLRHEEKGGNGAPAKTLTVKDNLENFVERMCGTGCDCMLENNGSCLYAEIIS